MGMNEQRSVAQAMGMNKWSVAGMRVNERSAAQAMGMNKWSWQVT